MKKLTIHEIQQLKGKRKLTAIFTREPDEAVAAAAAGIDILVTLTTYLKPIRRAVPDTFLMAAPFPFKQFDPSNEAAVRAGNAAMEDGADAIYCDCANMERVAALANCRIPVFGHVGFVPYRAHWTGGPRAFGRTAAEALQVYRHVKAYEAAGAVGVEMELVVDRVAAEITKRTKLSVNSLGSGPGCDMQYLFATDVLGTNKGHVPRHAKQYVDLNPEYDRLQKIMTEALTRFREEVTSGAYPEPRHIIEVKEDEFTQFMAGIEK
jgi:3-methyl-2-oxobutanoate hydroxymethyltransferase